MSHQAQLKAYAEQWGEKQNLNKFDTSFFPCWYQKRSGHCHDSGFLRVYRCFCRHAASAPDSMSLCGHSCTSRGTAVLAWDAAAWELKTHEDNERSSVKGEGNRMGGKGHYMKGIPVHQIQSSKCTLYLCQEQTIVTGLSIMAGHKPDLQETRRSWKLQFLEQLFCGRRGMKQNGYR